MIQLLATRYSRQIAYCMALIFYVSMALPGYGRSGRQAAGSILRSSYSGGIGLHVPLHTLPVIKEMSVTGNNREERAKVITDRKKDIGGPNQPEMSSFKSIGTDNLVNLFTGDFSYNIPLLDVGGYPVNIFYSGGIGMEDEASWVGLGWNINPGNVNRNMRGIPDDFNGKDTLVQVQKMKPNTTWGFSVGGDIELAGIKDFLGVSIGSSIGLSFNNYLGPALEVGLKGGVNFKIAGKAASEKSPLGISLGYNANISSRSGLSFSPNVSLTSQAFSKSNDISVGASLSTTYNSRTGIKQLQLNEQMKLNIQNSAFGQTISFVRPSYIPAMRSPMTNEAHAGHFQMGGGMGSFYASGEIEAFFQQSKIASEDVIQLKPMVGYLYYQKGMNNRDAVMDFTRFNDQEVTPETPVISVPQYSYDVFSVQGEGTGGTIRAYRNDMGYVRDNYTSSSDKSISLGFDIGIPGHYGGNFNSIKTPSTVGEWENGNKLRNAVGFAGNTEGYEAIYFRNPGETSVLHPNQFDRIGGTDLVRFKLGGSDASPTLEPVLQKISAAAGTVTGEVSILAPGPLDRTKRSQVISFLTAEEAAHIGLNKWIKSYNTDTLIDADTLKYERINRIGGYRKEHLISQVNITEADGKRYVYDLPVYNIVQRDFSFTVNNSEISPGLVPFAANEAGSNSPHLSGNGPDGFVQITHTPAYAHSFLLGGLLSPDYVDVTGDGITGDDLGGAVKFNYTRIKQGGQWAKHKWRTPLTSGLVANYNAGNRSEKKDDKGIVSYGERESWYLHSVESKTMIAFFLLEDRHDGKGATDSLSGINSSDNSLKRLKRIDLYNKADLKKNGLAHAQAVKSVHFEYNYSLCAGAPDNTTSGEGKLTLAKIWFTYNGQPRANKNQYVFSYGSTSADNPSYAFAASDRWGVYKAASSNPSSMRNSDYPYALQNKTLYPVDKSAAAWSLKKILLPSGGQMDVEYESDDYAWVQNRRAASMMEIAGFGAASSSTPGNSLYNISGFSLVDNNYVFIKVPVACANAGEVYQKYLQGYSQLSFRLAVNMPKGVEYLTSYALINTASSANYGVTANPNIIWVKMEEADGISPLSRTAIEYLREQLPAQAFPGYDVSESSGLAEVADVLQGWLVSMKSAFKDVVKYLRSEGKAKTVITAQSFVRLNDPDGVKYGGGHRVKSVKLKDNWDKMTGQYGSVYGQEYDYTTTEVFNGTQRTISSGVASYEPSIGGEENPFQSIVQVANDIPLGPTSYGAIEMPVLDAFFPAPVVGYSKVTVRSLNKNTDPAKKSRSGIGRQVTEFYTAKEYPVYYNYTSLDPASDRQDRQSSLMAFFYKYAFDSRAISQGFIVATNDMHGKMKSQSSYAENDPATRLNYTQHFYRNTGANGLNEKFDFAYNAFGGEVRPGNMGIDIELMTDTREFSVKSSSLEIQAQLDWIIPAPPIWLPFIWPVIGKSENMYRAVTTTKVINYHSVLDSIVVIDKGSQVSTKNLVYDAETGEVIVNRTNNEFDKAVYSVTYPAYWAYSGMGPAYKNIDAVYPGITFLDGRITGGNIPDSMLESGDELYLVDTGAAPSTGCAAMLASKSTRLLWALDMNRNTGSLTTDAHDYLFIDGDGLLCTRNNVKLRIVRSGKRNVLEAPAAAVTMMTNPVATVSGVRKLVISDESKVINASAVEYREKWQTDNDVIKKYRTTLDVCTGISQELPDCSGHYEKNINPYRKGLLGTFRGYRNMVFYGDRTETNPAVATNISQNGFLHDFALYWDFDGNNNLVPATADTRWVWNSQVTRYNARGMELETKDALNIYTSAQYGFNKLLPVAITANSRYGEMFCEGFEDFGFGAGLLMEDCSSYASLTGPVSNTDSLAFNAHTGRFALRVNEGGVFAAYNKSFAITPAFNDSFSLYTLPDTTRSLSDPGGNAGMTVRVPTTLTLVPALPTVGGMGVSFDTHHAGDSVYTVSGDNIQVAEYVIHTDQYVEITTAGDYDILMRTWYDMGSPGATIPAVTGLFLTIRNLNDEIIATRSVNSTEDPDGTGTTFSFYLCAGIYKVEYRLTCDYQKTCPSEDYACQLNTLEYARFHASCSVSVNSYKSLSSEDGCIFTKPVAATDSMLHPVFKIPAGKKMLFSGWVREACGDPGTGTPCTAQTFANSKVQLTFNDGGSTMVEVKPAGPIIEGWQRMEGEFTAPAGATRMNMFLVNTGSSGPIYFDDIRIHPFNANMKSYVYDPLNLRLTAELDANNYASFYEYDEEGTLIRTKAETREGIKTITESRSAKQKNITTID